MRAFTIVTPATLPQARVLADSLSRHQPDWPHEVLLVGSGRGAEVEAWPQLRPVTDVLDIDVELLIARRDEEDLVALLLPRVLQSYAKQGSGPVLHLPPTAWVLDELEPVAMALSRHSVLLVPRMTADVPADGLQPTYAQMQRAGRISETVIGTDGTSAADGFLTWWAGHLETTLGSLDGGRGDTRPEDRQWLARLLELAPARFATAVLSDPGCNLSFWNLHEHTLALAATGVLVDARLPLRWLDLQGFRPDRPHRLSAIAERSRVSGSPALRELCCKYAEELAAVGWSRSDHLHDIGRQLQGELVGELAYDDTLRALHVLAEALGERFGDVFTTAGADAFIAWLTGPAPAGHAYGVNRYVFYRVLRERPDVMQVYPDLDGANGLGFVGWCWVFGREEMALRERFLPPQPDWLAVDSAAAAGAESAPAADAASVEDAGAGESVGSMDAATSVGVAEPAGAAGTAEPVGAVGAARSSTEAAGSAPAVRVTGYLSHTLGLGAAARGYAQALAAAGVAVSTASVPLHHLELPVELQAGYGRHAYEDTIRGAGDHNARHDFEIVAVNADELPDFVARLGEDFFAGPRIGIWGWETNSIPPRWQRAFALVREIWVYSRFMAENLGAVAPVPVIALPPPVLAPAEPALPLRLNVPADGFLFLFVFDYLSTIQRKNPVGLIEAFKRAFAPGEGPRLLLKTINAPLRPLAEEEVLWAAHGRPDVHVVDRSLSGQELNGLMAACDCYVSLHRSEGFGLTLAEAMAIGKPVIGTRYSGNTDFMSAENSYLVDYELGRVGPECEIYPPDGEWAQPSVEHAAELMRRVVERPEEAAVIGAKAREDIARMLSPQVTGAGMRERLEALAEG